MSDLYRDFPEFFPLIFTSVFNVLHSFQLMFIGAQLRPFFNIFIVALYYSGTFLICFWVSIRSLRFSEILHNFLGFFQNFVLFMGLNWDYMNLMT
jgi:hypothetical protein